VSQLTDSLHSFTLLTVKLPLKDSAEIWTRDLKAYAPTFLLNHHNKFSAWPYFQRFFTSTVNQTQNSNLISFLFKPNQNPVIFLNWMASLFLDTEELFLVESYILIYNKKSSLLRDLAEIKQLDLPRHYLSRSDYTASASTKPRSKRSTWGKFWAGVLIMASSEDIKKVQTVEHENSLNEFSMQAALSKLSKTNYQLKDSLSQLSLTLGNITNKQQMMFSQVSYLNSIISYTMSFFE
jgi:hypothetical protein